MFASYCIYMYIYIHVYIYIYISGVVWCVFFIGYVFYLVFVWGIFLEIFSSAMSGGGCAVCVGAGWGRGGGCDYRDVCVCVVCVL